MTRMVPTWSAIAVICVCSLIAAITMQPGLDYFSDSGAIDALVRGDVHGFFAGQPLMGPLSLLLRAPFVAPVFHSGIDTVYLVGVIPLYGALLALTLVLWRRTPDRPPVERLTIVLLSAGSPLVIRAVHWGHPEELLAAVLCTGSLLAALRGAGGVSGVLLGLAFATKQWALLAAAPTFAVLPRGRRHYVLGAVGVALAFTLPMALGDPDRFTVITRAAGSGDPSAALAAGGVSPGLVRVTPQSIWFPLATSHTVAGAHVYAISGGLGRLAHPLILLLSPGLTWMAWRGRRRPLPAAVALRVLALVYLARCALDPNDIDYYHVPLVLTLATLGALGGRDELRAAVLGVAGLSLAFSVPADSLRDLIVHPWPQSIAYAAVAAGLGGWLATGLVPGARTTPQVMTPSAGTVQAR